MEKANVKKTGLGLAEILTIIFIVLKLTDTITWSWWWVLSPVLIPVGLVLLFLLIFGIVIYMEEH